MKHLFTQTIRRAILAMSFLGCVTSAIAGDRKTGEPAIEAPVVFPGLDHYQDLWEKSLFTSHALPKAPATGPSFTDALNLAGIYDIDGRTIAVVMDKATSQIIEITTTADKNHEMQLIEVDRGTSPYKSRVQIQRGNDSGWVAFPDSAQGNGPAAPSIPAPQGVTSPDILPSRRALPEPTPPAPIVPSVPTAAPNITPTANGDAPSPPE